MPYEIECQWCGAPLEEDEEFEHRTCVACIYGVGPGENIEEIMA